MHDTILGAALHIDTTGLLRRTTLAETDRGRLIMSKHPRKCPRTLQWRWWSSRDIRHHTSNIRQPTSATPASARVFLCPCLACHHLRETLAVLAQAHPSHPILLSLPPAIHPNYTQPRHLNSTLQRVSNTDKLPQPQYTKREAAPREEQCNTQEEKKDTQRYIMTIPLQTSDIPAMPP